MAARDIFAGSWRRVAWGPVSLLCTLALALLLVHLPPVHSPPIPVVARVSGTFSQPGGIPTGQRPPDGSRVWSSWREDGAHSGYVTLQGGVAPATIGLYIAGHPDADERNVIIVRDDASMERFRAVVWSGHDRWRFVAFDLPKPLRGHPFRIKVSNPPTGWVAISEPHAVPWYCFWWRTSFTRFVVFTATGCLLLLLASLAAVGVERWKLPAELTLPASLATVAAAGYVLFWLFFASARLGTAATWLALTVGLAAGSRARARGQIQDVWRRPDWRRPAALMFAAGLLYLAATTLYRSDEERTLSSLGTMRFLSLPIDNQLPHLFAERLANSQSPRRLAGDWLSSDRPPLQTGWVLLATTALHPLWFPDFDGAGQSAGIWFQLLWIAAVWAWTRSCGGSARASTAIVVALVPCGVLLVNTTFVWPKIGASALLLTAVLILLPRSAAARDRTWFVVGASGVALAWLSHSAVAFALIALAPFVLVRLRTTGIAVWAIAGLTFLVWAAPWAAYQRFYEPPGNRLLKWHLAGVQAIEDQRGGLETLVDSYRGIRLGEWLDRRQANLVTYARGPWWPLLSFDFRDLTRRRAAEFFYTLFSLGFWNLGWLALAARLLSRPRPSADDTLAFALAWAALTALVTAVFLFDREATVIHQGSYSVLLLSLVACALALWRVHSLLVAAVAAAQSLTFFRVWLSAPLGFPDSEVEPIAAVVLVLAALWLSVLALAAVFGRQRDRR